MKYFVAWDLDIRILNYNYEMEIPITELNIVERSLCAITNLASFDFMDPFNSENVDIEILEKSYLVL